MCSSIPAYNISVIVPIYNCQNTVRRLLDSLIGQTFENYEIIIINDGSTDNTLSICTEYAQRYSYVRIIDKANEGVAMARELGIRNAKGEYIIHADGDDWVEPEMLSCMYETIINEDADILISDFYVDTDQERLYRTQKFSHKSSEDIFYDIISGRLMGSLWNKLIRRELYFDNIQYFYPGINYFEDVLSLSKIMVKQDITIVHLDRAFYHYVVNKFSITNNITALTYEGLLKYRNTLRSILPNEERFNDYLEEFSITLFELAFSNDFISGDKEEEDYKLIAPQIKKFRKGRRAYAHILYKMGLKRIAKRIIKMGNWFI